MKYLQEVGSPWIPSDRPWSSQMVITLTGVCVVACAVVGMLVVGMLVVGMGVVVVIEAGAVGAPEGSLQLWLMGQSQALVTALKVRPWAHWTLKAWPLVHMK